MRGWPYGRSETSACLVHGCLADRQLVCAPKLEHARGMQCLLHMRL